jgi:hypothetical protein
VGPAACVAGGLAWLAIASAAATVAGRRVLEA